jgi:glucose/arabinose dehydrogenase
MRDKRSFNRVIRVAVGAAVLASMALPAAAAASEVPAGAQAPLAAPSGYRVRTILRGLDHPWDVAFRPNHTMFVTERGGWIGLRMRGGRYIRLHRPADLVANGEGGMLGLALSPRFRRNRELFVCFNTASDVRVVRFRYAGRPRRLINRRDIVTGIEANPSGRHSGCRLEFGPDGYLWITTGDAARGTNPQNLNVLNGKVLRVTRRGRPAPGNYRGRIFAYGFRNPQGLSFRPGTNRAFIVEHGPGCDDEITPLRRGGNGGWNPVGSFYNENVPMTNTSLPRVLRPVWSSGCPTIAPSGGTFVTHRDWGSFRGRMVIAVLKDQHLRVINVARGVADQGRVILQGQGRLRNAVPGPGGRLYIPVDADDGRIITLDPRP